MEENIMIAPEALAEQLIARVGRAERPEAQIQRTLMERIDLLPNKIGTPYVVIKATGNILREPMLTVEQAVSNYCNVRNARHDLWYTKIHDSRFPRWDTGGLETNFGNFMDNVLEFRNYDTSYNTMTPDFLMVSDNDVLIGDVAVTSTYRMTKQKKHEKYMPLKHILSETDRQVHHVDFILKEDMSNFLQEIRKFVQKEVIPNNVNFTDEIAYSMIATELMLAIKDMCENRHSFNICLETGKIPSTAINYSILSDMLHKEVIETPLDKYIPHNREEKLFDIIKEEVERVGGANYFDQSMDGVDDAFKTVIDNNMDKEQMSPKSTLKVVDNSHDYNDKVAHELIEDYIKDLAQSDDDDVKYYILDLLPTLEQLSLMKKIKDEKLSNKHIRDDPNMKRARVGGEYQYKRRTAGSNPLTQILEIKLRKGKMNHNEKKVPRVIDMSRIDSYAEDINRSISYYGSASNKPPFLDDSWDSYNKLEEDNTIEEKEVYDYCRKTNGAQLCNSLSALYNRITHMGIKMGTYDNIFIPPNGSFICIMPKNHAPVTHRTCDMPFIFITRAPVKTPLNHVEDHNRFSNKKYIYYVSKLSRLNVAKISCWDNAGHRLVASASYIISKCPALANDKSKVVGLLSYLIVDVHQKISEYLDLLKYISFMPFADLHVLPKLILDKCDLLMKTKMDAWMFRQIRMYIKELSILDKLKARKPVMKMQNGVVLQESLGITMELPSFFNLNVRHVDPTDFIEEIGIIFASRPKHLYGSQFLDESTTKTAEWDVEYDKEVDTHGGWCTTGIGTTPYPFDAKFAFHADAIYFATQLLEQNIDGTESKIESHLFSGPYGNFLHTNCSLRGCTKEKKDRTNQNDMHTTSIDACLKLYKELEYKDDSCRTITIGQNFCISKGIMEFSMSEKDQRGGGRPIATPTLGAKAALMLIEKPEASIGTFTPNNILVAGKSKIKEQHQTYTTAISHGASIGLKNVYQLTEDQSKYSENDNPRKYEIYLRSSELLKKDIRKLQLVALRKLYNRHHLVHRIPKKIEASGALSAKVVSDNWTRGVKASIGWPQGMLNNISTTIHSAADYWILKAFKNSYPDINIHARGLVHSDDSWVTVCTDSLKDFKLFTVYRMIAKKLFCLKINEKKLWGGKYLGELVSNYNLNGKVHLATSKVLSNGLSNLTYQNWPVDVSTQISTIQQVYRTGATLGTLIMLATILRQQIISAYQVTGKQKEHLYDLPVELGGYPKCSVFKLGVGGVDAVYDELTKKYTQNPNSECTKIVLGAVVITRQYLREINLKAQNEDKDYAEIIMPSRGEIFRGIRYLMPKSKKLTSALKTIEEVTALFPSDGLGLIITKPITLAESLGHLRDTTMTNMYKLAAEKYTQSVRRLASSQAQQSSGKVVKIGPGLTMTMNCMYEFLLALQPNGEDLDMINSALEPESEVIHACSCIVDTAYIASDQTPLRGSVINKMPEYDTVYDTISPMVDVLLYILDTSDKYRSREVKFYDMYGSYKSSQGTLEADKRHLMNRFNKYFTYYPVEKACSLIMQSKLNIVKERSWVQPKIYADTMGGFLKGLYGVTLRKGVRYNVEANIPTEYSHHHSASMIKSIYSTSVINRIYKDQFKIETVNNKTLKEALLDIDQSRLDRNDMLKLAVMRFIEDDNRDLLDKIYESDRFSYRWVVPQEYYQGRYRGDWELEFRLGRMSGNISRALGRVSIVVTEANLFMLLKAMRIIAERCFSKGYEYDTCWWNCSIWRQTEQPTTGYTLYLKSYGAFESILSPTYVTDSIGVLVDQTAIFYEHIASRLPDDYIIDDTLRTISVKFNYSSQTDSRFRMGSIFQDLTIPLRNEIELVPYTMQGFLNRTIFRYGIIEDLILSRHISTPATKLMDMLERAQGINKLEPIWDLFRNTNRKLNKIPVSIRQVLADTDVTELTWDCTPMGCQEMYDFQETAEVEKLENVVFEYETQSIRAQHKLKYVPNIMEAICKTLWGGITLENKLDFVNKIVRHPGLKGIITRFPEEDMHRISSNITEYAGYYQLTGKLHSFVVGCGFNTKELWEEVNREALLRLSYQPVPFHGEQELVEEFIDLIRALFDLDPYVDEEEDVYFRLE
ncbi:RdRp [Coredo virus]|uniref:RNA-directed RNA polymerase L n=1 Tax=Coredo virus TaxID=2689366 RepID=A0A6B9KGI8_9VIRU|nr:RdRp [Coredo virus]QHA33845.1 RdRp [Coredo virus]